MNKFWGKVRKHNQRGKKLGFPTANVNLRKKIPEGIYISQTKIGQNLFPSLLSALPGLLKKKTFVQKPIFWILKKTFMINGFRLN